MFRTRLIRLAATGLALALATPTGSVLVQGAEPGKAPSFRDDRRFAPARPAAETPGTREHGPGTGDLPTRSEAAKPCPPATTASLPLEGGRMQITISSACRAGQDVVWRYGGGEFQASLDAGGQAVIIVDAFAGGALPVEIAFADETTAILPIETLELDRVTKIAVLWRASVDLDLNAFEYAASPGQSGHVSATSTASIATVREQVENGVQGHGAMTTISGQDAPRDRLEVYTFWHKDAQNSGFVGTAIDHASRGAHPNGETCGSGALAEVPFRIVTLTRQGKVIRESGIIAAAECGRALDAAMRFTQPTMPMIRIRKERGGERDERAAQKGT